MNNWHITIVKSMLYTITMEKPSHSVHGLDLHYVRVEFLPPNTTSEIQPMDAGIIRNVKVHYKRHLMKYYVQCLDDNGQLERINLKQAIYHTHDAWKDVKQSTIANCYRHTGILPQNNDETDVTSDVTPEPVLHELRILLTDFAVDNTGTMSVEEYIDVDEQVATEELLTDKDIVSMVRPNTRDSDDSSDEEPEPVQRVNGKEAITGMEKSLLYMEQGGFTTEEMDYIRVLTDRMRSLQLKSRSQKKLTDFFL